MRLKWYGKSQDEIGEIMGHSNSQVTEHYLASLVMDIKWEINKGSFLKTCQVFCQVFVDL